MTGVPASPAITASDLQEITETGVPMMRDFGVVVDRLGVGFARLRLPYTATLVRPGGTVAGPALFALADYALFAAVLTLIGRVELTVTTSMTINFLRRPAPKDVLAEARVLKCGKRLAYGEIILYSEGETEPVAHVTGTYSIPPHAPMSVPMPHYHDVTEATAPEERTGDADATGPASR